MDVQIFHVIAWYTQSHISNNSCSLFSEILNNYVHCLLRTQNYPRINLDIVSYQRSFQNVTFTLYCVVRARQRIPSHVNIYERCGEYVEQLKLFR